MARPIIYRARTLLQPDLSVVDNGAVACSPEGIIIEAGRHELVKKAVSAAEIDLGEVFLIPGLINAHVHLKFSLTDAIRPSPTPYFPFWLRQLVSWGIRLSLKEREQNIRRGIEHCQARGITTVFDISSASEIDFWRPVKLRRWLFYEAIGLEGQREEGALKGLNNFVPQLPGDNRLTFRGISPHAPYSVSPQLFRAAAALAKQYNLPLAIHVAETWEENEMIIDGQGELFDLLKKFKVLSVSWRPPRVSPTAYLDQLEMLGPHTLLIHFNYPLPGDIEILKKRGCSVAYCPGSHRFFSHGAHPLPQLLAAGINVCLGTDSLASNFDLDMLREMKIVKQEFPQLPEAAIFKMATIKAAQAIGQDQQLGLLARGFFCDAAAIMADDKPMAGIKDIFEADKIKVKATIVAGEMVFSA